MHAGDHAFGLISLPSCRALVQHNAKVNEPDGRMRTPLFLAYEHGHVRVGHYLWERGADPTMSYGLHTSLCQHALRVRRLLVRAASLHRKPDVPPGAACSWLVVMRAIAFESSVSAACAGLTLMRHNLRQLYR